MEKEEREELEEYIRNLFLNYGCNEEETAELTWEAIEKANKNFDPKRGASLKTYSWTIGERLLIDKYRKEVRIFADGPLLKSGEQYAEALLEYPFDETILDEAGFDYGNWTDREKKWAALVANTFPARLTETATAEIMNVDRSTVWRIRKKLQKRFKGYYDNLKKQQAEAEEVGLVYGHPDPTPRKALKKFK